MIIKIFVKSDGSIFMVWELFIELNGILIVFWYILFILVDLDFL